MQRALILLIVLMTAFALGPIWPRRTAVGGGGFDIYEQVWANLNDWTDNAGTWSVSAGEVIHTSSSAATQPGYLFYDADTATSQDQYCCFKYVEEGAATFNNIDCIFRGEGLTATDDYMRVRYSTPDDTASLFVWNGTTQVAAYSASDESCFDATFTEGEYMCARISGSGATTLVEYWDFDTTPPASYDDTTYGDAECCLGFAASSPGGCTNYTDIGTASGSETSGSYLGLYTWINTTSGTIKRDDVRLGDADN